jgi:hypothetical protein
MASSSSDVKVPVAQAETFPDGTTDHVPLRKRTYDIRKPHITEQPITLAHWYQHVNWLNTLFIVMVPMVGLISSYWVSPHLKTIIFAVAYYYFAGLGISKLASSWSCYVTQVQITNIPSSCRLPSSVGSLELQGLASPQDLPRRRWRCRR